VAVPGGDPGRLVARYRRLRDQRENRRRAHLLRVTYEINIGDNTFNTEREFPESIVPCGQQGYSS